MLGFDKVVEQKIQESLRNGELDNLELKGKPLDLSDLSGVPEDYRMGYKILKNSGLLPEEMQLKKDISAIEELIKSGNLSEDKAKSEKEKLKDKIISYKMMMERRK